MTSASYWRRCEHTDPPLELAVALTCFVPVPHALEHEPQTVGINCQCLVVSVADQFAVREYEKRGKRFEDVCLIYATAALIEAEDLNGGYGLFVERGRSIPVLAVTAFPAPVERSLTFGDAGTLQPLFPDKWLLHSQDLAVAYHDAGAFFFIGAERLVGDTVTVYRDMLPYVLPRHKAIDIDEPEDLAFAEVVYRGSVKSIDET